MPRSLAGRLFPPAVIFSLLLFALLLVLFRERGFYDPGSLWHVKVGEIILDKGFPWTDPFTYTFANQTWIPQQWGAEVLMALAHRVGGFDTMLLGFAAGIAALYAWIFARASRCGMSPILAALVVGLFLAAGGFHYFVRPHMFTIALLGWTMACIVDFEQNRVSISRLAWLIPLFVVWTNLHGGVLGGIMTLGLAVAGWGFLYFVPPRLLRWKLSGKLGLWKMKLAFFLGTPRPPIRSRRTFLILVGIVLACLLTPIVNPFGLDMLRTWQKLIGSPVLKEVVSEHMPLDLAKAPDKVMLVVGVVYIVLLAGVLPWRPRVSWVLPLVWFALTFQSIRQGPLFAITAVIAVADFWPYTIWYRLLKKYGDTLVTEPEKESTRIRLGWPAFAVPTAVVVVCLGLQAAQVPVPVIGRGWVRLDPEMTPIDLNEVMQSYAASVPPGTPIFNDANLGGYLIYFTPSLKIFMDDRCELFGDDWIDHYVKTLALPPKELGEAFEKWQSKYLFERALVMTAPAGEKKTNIEEYLLSDPKRWREVARGKRAVLFERVK